MITLSFTKAFYVGDSGTGQQGASDLAAGIASAVFKSAPAATRVTVFDADNTVLGGFNKTDLAK